MKLTWVIQLGKNVFAINNVIKVLTFHELDLTKVSGRGLYGSETDARDVPGTARDFSNGPGRVGKKVMSSGRPAPGLKNRPVQTSIVNHQKFKSDSLQHPE